MNTRTERGKEGEYLKSGDIHGLLRYMTGGER
jgi:hypothetical protein